MDVKKSKTAVYVLTLLELEFSVLHKFIGRTSYNDRKKIADLSDEENDIISELYQDMDIGNGE